ncbi:MAG: hypothetical protein PF961_10610 [Planctomycetota bacterium]|jgi:hypothetical protein|nr:hypothetical protein [Planctomycetota bacterium]
MAVEVPVNTQAAFENMLPNPIRSARLLRIWGTIAVAMVAALTPFLLDYWVVAALLMLSGTTAVVWSMVLIQRARRDEIELYKSRLYSIKALPAHPDEAQQEKKDIKLPLAEREGQWWRQRGPSFTHEQIEETIYQANGDERTQCYWRRVLVPETATQHRAFAVYVREKCPELYRIIAEWWKEFHADEVASQLWAGQTFEGLDFDGQALVRTRTEVEFLTGCHIALEPDTWLVREDKRPSHRTYSLLRQRLAAVLPGGAPATAIIDAAPWVWRPIRKKLYVGKGYQWGNDHCLAMHYSRYFAKGQVRKGRHKKAAKEGEDLRADPRFLGLDWRKIAPVWTDYEKDLKQHTLFMGASGYGKTRGVEPLLIQSIYNGSAVVWKDPKVDNEAVALIAHHAKLAGREQQIVFLSVSRPELPYNCSFNPISGFHDPSQIGNILAGMMPADAGQNQFFLEEAKNTGRIVGTQVDWVNKWMSLLSDGDDLAWHPPRLVLWLEWARVNKLHVASDSEKGSERKTRIDASWAEFLESEKRLRAEDRDYRPRSPGEECLFTLWNQPQYCARWWKLHFGHLNDFALNNRQRLFSWTMRLVFPYLCIEEDRFRDPLFPVSDNLEVVTGYTPPMQPANKEKATPLVEVYERASTHILEPNGMLRADTKRNSWAYLYEVALDATQLPQVHHILERMQRSIGELLGSIKRPPEEYGQAVANLRAPINEIVAGEKFELLCSADPDITWKRIHEEKLIVILALGSMTDQKASDAVSKAFVQSLLGYGGHIQDRGGADLDLLYVGDEMFSWITADWASIVDKLRGTGVRTVGLCQSEAGMRYATKNPDLFTHIVTNVTNRYTCASPNRADQEAFTNGLGTVIGFVPVRTVTETPALGSAGNQQVSQFSGSESWNWTSEKLPKLEPEYIGKMPIGMFFRRVQDLLHVYQAPLVERAPVSYLAQVGMDAKNNRCLLEGIDYGVAGGDHLRRLQGWGSAERLFTSADANNTSHLDVVAPVSATPVPAAASLPQTILQEISLATGDDGPISDEEAAKLAAEQAQADAFQAALSAEGMGDDEDDDEQAFVAEMERRAQAQEAADAIDEPEVIDDEDGDDLPPGDDDDPSDDDDDPWAAVESGAEEAPEDDWWDQDGPLPVDQEPTEPVAVELTDDRGGYQKGHRDRKGRKTGSWTVHEPNGDAVAEVLYREDAPVAERPAGPSVSEQEKCREAYPEHDGWVYCGLRMAGKRIFSWLVLDEEDRTRERHRYGMDGRPKGVWEVLDETGATIETKPAPLEGP